MALFGEASGSIWENWLADHSKWIEEASDPFDAIGRVLWTPIGAASTAVAAYADEFERHPGGTVAKTAGVAVSALIPGAGVLAVAADAAAVATGQVIGSELIREQDRHDADQHERLQHQATVQANAAGRSELNDLFF